MSDFIPESVVIGTAGHIDHGKSALVRALTGVDPDRLAEERKRGITIELGFARLDLPNGTSASLVDVPGHERFVRQMIAGASGMDAALLAIAADDGIMPQTREHLAVLRLLAIPTCVVALTKCDMVDEEWADFVAEEVAGMMEGTPYEGCPVVKTSSKTGEGLDELREALQKAVLSGKRAHGSYGLRLPVDRSFTVKGSGTVVTGTLWSGTAQVGDEVRIMPEGTTTRIRSIQVHGQDVSSTGPGHRVAMNLNAVSTEQARPGDFIVAVGSPEPSDRFDATLTYLDPEGNGKPFKTGSRVRIAHGTREVLGRVLLMDEQRQLEPGQRSRAQVRIESPLSVQRGDRFVVRSYSPVRVVGGGTVLLSHPRRRSILDDADRTLLEALEAGEVTQALRALFAKPGSYLTPHDAAAMLDLKESEALAALRSIVEAHGAVELGGDRTPVFTSRTNLQKTVAGLENALMSFHAKHPTELGMSKEALHHEATPALDARAFEAVLIRAADAGSLAMSDGIVSHPKAGAGARAKADQRAHAVLETMREAGATPPSVPEVQGLLGCSSAEAYAAFVRLEKEGRLVKIDRDLYYSAEAFETLLNAVRRTLEETGSANAAQLRDAMGVSRKFAIPVLEKIDALGITRRDGDQRTLR